MKLQKQCLNHECHPNNTDVPTQKIALFVVLGLVTVLATGGLALAGYFFFKNLQLDSDEIE